MLRAARQVGAQRMSLPTAGPSVTGNSVLLPGAGAADHGPRYEQPGEEEPDETPPAVGHMDHDGGSDRDACQHGDRRRYEVPGRSASRSLSSPQVRAARARPVRSSNSPAVSLPAWKCSLRSDTTASRSESAAFISAGR